MRLALFAVAVVPVLAALPAQAQTAYPAKTLGIVVPLAPGGNVDIVVRALAQTISGNIGLGDIFRAYQTARARPVPMMICWVSSNAAWN